MRLAAAAIRPIRSNRIGRAISIYITTLSEHLKVAISQAHGMSPTAIPPPSTHVIYRLIVILDSFSKLQMLWLLLGPYRKLTI